MYPVLLGVSILVIAGLVVALLRKGKPAPVLGNSQVAAPRAVSDQLQYTSNALFATLSHELRTPLNGLLGIAQMLNEERQDEDIIAIEGCARHMLAVLHTLVNLSKIQMEWDDLPEYREWVSVYELSEQVKKNVEFRANLRGLTIRLEHQDKTTRLRGDWDHLRTILENAILGSVEGVELNKVPSQVRPIPISWTASGADVHFQITNPIETLHEDQAERIKEAFNMTTGANHARIDMQFLYGAVSTALLEKNHGVLLTEKAEAGGVLTRLSFEMEQMQSSPSDKLPVGGLALSNQGQDEKRQSLKIPVKLSILVAEDDPISRSLMDSVLKHMGQEVQFAINGREVLECVSEHSKFDVILMDIDMPLMDGVSAAIALRNAEAGPNGISVPIVALTAFNTLSDQGKFKRAGMEYFLAKPVKLKDLRRVLVDVIRKEQHVSDIE